MYQQMWTMFHGEEQQRSSLVCSQAAEQVSKQRYLGTDGKRGGKKEGVAIDAGSGRRRCMVVGFPPLQWCALCIGCTLGVHWGALGGQWCTVGVSGFSCPRCSGTSSPCRSAAISSVPAPRVQITDLIISSAAPHEGSSTVSSNKLHYGLFFFNIQTLHPASAPSPSHHHHFAVIIALTTTTNSIPRLRRLQPQAQTGLTTRISTSPFRVAVMQAQDTINLTGLTSLRGCSIDLDQRPIHRRALLLGPPASLAATFFLPACDPVDFPTSLHCGLLLATSIAS